MRFEFATATRIIFGAGTLPEIGPEAKKMGHRATVVIGVPRIQVKPLLDVLDAQSVTYHIISVEGEPSVDRVKQGVQSARDHDSDLVIGFGGGSAIDAGKAIAAMLTNKGDILDYLEVIGQGKSITQPPVPYIAVPTTSGTGAEVTRNAVLASPGHHVKVSLRSPMMLPRLALIDPELTYTLPPNVTASTGLDALTQVIEPFVSNKANPMTDAFCREGMHYGSIALKKAFMFGNDPEARTQMSLTSLFGGLALANSALGAAHGFAGPIGGMFPAPHGAVCARLLPFVMEANIVAMRARDSRNVALGRYDEVAKLLTGNEAARAEDGAAWVQQLCRELNIPSLSSYGVTAGDIEEIVTKSARASSMKGNPIQLTLAELHSIMERAL